MVAVGVCDDAAKDFVRIRIDDTSRAGIFFGFGVVIILMTVRKDGEFQQIVVISSVSIFAVMGFPVAVADAETNGLKTFLEVAIVVISIGKPVWIAAFRLPIRERRRVGVTLCGVLRVPQRPATVLTAPGLRAVSFRVIKGKNHSR